jgi:hypothetical protein
VTVISLTIISATVISSFVFLSTIISLIGRMLYKTQKSYKALRHIIKDE